MPFLRGLGMTASMIVALGPQNAYLLKHGLQRKITVFKIAAIYVLIDVVLITLGAVGVGSIIASTPVLKLAFSIIAAVFFFIYGMLNLRAAFRPRPKNVSILSQRTSYSTAIFISVANPGVLFDTIVIVGGLAAQYTEISDRIAFSSGAAAASFLWFFTISGLSFYGGKYVSAEAFWKYLDIGVGTLMMVLAGVISLDVIEMLYEMHWLPM